MKDLSKGKVVVKGFSMEVTTVRPETYLGVLPQPKEFVPQMTTTTRSIKLEEHVVEYENNLDMSPDEIQSTNKVVLEMIQLIANAAVTLGCASMADDKARRQHEKDMANLNNKDKCAGGPATA